MSAATRVHLTMEAAVEPPDSEEVTRDTVAYLEALGIARIECGCAEFCPTTEADTKKHAHFACGCSVYEDVGGGLVVACARHEKALYR